MSSWEPEILIDEPVVDPEAGAEMLGLHVFAEPPEGTVGLARIRCRKQTEPVVPRSKNFLLEEIVEVDWLRF
jgi:hypothetical protein